MNARIPVGLILLAICGSFGGCQDSEAQPEAVLPVAGSTAPSGNSQQRTESQTATVNPKLLAQSSWQDPFVADFWQSTGWEFTATDMHAGASASSATLRRPWSRLMLEAKLEAGKNAQESVGRILALSLSATDSAARVRIAIQTDRADWEHLNGRKWQTLRSADLEDAVTSGRVRVNLTGNRVLVAWNDRLVLNVDRPTGIRGPVLVNLSTFGGPVTISQMRVEGEGPSSRASLSRHSGAM